MSDDEFFDIVDSHPMTDEEATRRLTIIKPDRLPHYEEYLIAATGAMSGDLQWMEDYKEYTTAWANFCLSRVDRHWKVKPWTAESRKQLIELERYFESTAVDWI